jgi:D-alanyl-D-alanine carboxypeptidase
MIKNKIYWLNTNKLLGKKGCKGVKTGFTKSAGGCLSTLFEVKK